MVIDRSGQRDPSPRQRDAHPFAIGIVFLFVAVLGARSPARADEDYSDQPRLERVDRSVSLCRPDQGEEGDHRRRWLTWRIEYRLRNAGREPLLIEPGTVFCTIEGWVSNSRAEGHGLPRRADHSLSAGDELESIATLIESDEPVRCCRERATLQVWPEEGPTPVEPAPGASCGPPAEPFTLAPGEILLARLRLEHRHHLHGPIEPLLGEREITLRVGPTSYRDAVLLDVIPAADRPIDRLGPIPDDRRDHRFYYSPPDSLYLDAALAGHRTYQFRDLKVCRDTPMRLSFRYYRSIDSTGNAHAELKQYHDIPNSYRALTEAKRVESLDCLGEWILVEHNFRSEALATTMQLKFVLNCEGDGPSAIWIDDVVLEPVEESSERP